MKSSKLIMGCLSTLALTTGLAMAQDNAAHDAIAERLKPVGQLCLQGEDCGSAAAAASAPAVASSGGIDGAGIYNSVCMACHETGAAGAPVRGDEAAWAGRIDQGFATLLDHSINGIGAMPAKGGNPNLSDAEVEAATAYLVEPVMEVPELAAEEEAPAEDMDATEEVAAEAEAPAEEMASNDDATTEEATTEVTAQEETTLVAEADGSANGGGSGLDGAALYGSSGCAACHASGAAGAPIVGDADAWAPRIEKGTETLYASAINGIGAMPPKGGNMGLSDEEVEAIVDYMVADSQ